MTGASGARLFIAAEMPAELKRVYTSLREELRRALPEGRWARAEGIHLTFKFLGATAEDRIAPLAEAIGPVAAVAPPFTLVTAAPGIFGSPSRPRVLWLGLEGEVEAAVRLSEKVEAAVAPLGFQREQRPFRPHLTLARFDTAHTVKLVPAILETIHRAMGGAEMRVSSLAVFESFLKPGGAEYRLRRAFTLGSWGGGA